ncbi:MAG: aminotransferase class IV [Gemmatimonadales bacterium]|nr:aminotransferase class IV [Gemmatimonadales bacterium]
MRHRSPGLIETVRVRDGVAPLWGFHLARLMRSCRSVGIEPPLALETPAGGADRVVRLVVRSGEVERSERPIGATRPVRLVTSAVRHVPYPDKTTNRAPFDRARAEAEAAGADDGMMLVAGGWVAETAVWGVYWWEGDRLCAPPLELGLLRSVARERVREVVGEIDERRAAPAELTSRAAFVANAARGVIHVASIDGVSVVESSRTARVAGLFWA